MFQSEEVTYYPDFSFLTVTNKHAKYIYAIITRKIHWFEESIRQYLHTYVTFLDAKFAFDVVNHSSLKRKHFHMGIEGHILNFIDSLHTNAETMVMWCGQLSDKFDIQQGVRQGGVLSTDFYMSYDNKLTGSL